MAGPIEAPPRSPQRKRSCVRRAPVKRGRGCTGGHGWGGRHGQGLTLVPSPQLPVIKMPTAATEVARPVHRRGGGRGDGALCSELVGYRMANLERGFRRVTLAASVLLMLPFLGATIPSFLAGDFPAALFGLGLTVLAFLLPWLLFVVSRWIAGGFRD